MKLFLPILDNGNGSVMKSYMVDFIAAFQGRTYLIMQAGDSHANRGMNKIANAFLDTDCDVWINIDADIRFRKMDIDNLLSHDLPLVYGIYPKKDDETDPCLCTFATVEPDAKGLAEVRRCGRGFMLVKREVLEAMKEDNGGPALRYHNHASTIGEKSEWDFFTSGPVTGGFSAIPAGTDKDGFPLREWISEDWYFCERARKLGYKTLVDTNIALGHVGLKAYYFSGHQVIRMDSNITCWQNIHGWFDYENLYRRLAEELGSRKVETLRALRCTCNPASEGCTCGYCGWNTPEDPHPHTPPPPPGFTRNTVFVEVGCWLGRSIGAMAEFVRGSGVELHVVDTFEGSPGNGEHASILKAHGGNIEKPFRANMQALKIHCTTFPGPRCNIHCEHCAAAHKAYDPDEQHIFVHSKTSVAAAKDFENESLDAVFIDDDHHEEFVKASIEAWLPKVKPGGIICGHDIDEAGVAAAVNAAFPKYETVGRCWLVCRAEALAKTGGSPDPPCLSSRRAGLP